MRRVILTIPSRLTSLETPICPVYALAICIVTVGRVSSMM